MALLRQEAAHRPHPLHSAGLTAATGLLPSGATPSVQSMAPKGQMVRHLPQKEQSEGFIVETSASVTTLPRDMGAAALAALSPHRGAARRQAELVAGLVRK